MKKFLIAAGVALVVIGFGIFLSKQSNPSAPPANSTPASSSNGLASVPNDTQLMANLKLAGLDALSTEGTQMHIHQHLDIMINNKAVAVPAEIGIGSNFISPLHVHDDTGILHVESPVLKDFTLGQFFTEWGVVLNDNCLGTNCADSTHKFVVAVNGSSITQHPQDLILKPHDEIELWYGDVNTNPEFIKSYTFPDGY